MFSRLTAFLSQRKNSRQTIINNTFWLTAGQLGSRVIRAVLVIYAARALGADSYGVVSYVLSLTAFFAIFSDLGLSGFLTRELVQKQREIQSYVSTIFIMRIVVILLAVALIIYIAPLITTIESARSLIPIAALLLIFDSIRNFNISISRSQNRMDLEASFYIITEIFITTIGLSAIFLYPYAEPLVIAYAIGSGLGAFISVLLLARYYRNIFLYFSFALVKPILYSAMPFAIMGMLGPFMINIDILIIGWLRNAYDVGLYAAAQRVVQLIYIIPALLAAGSFPVISMLVRNNQTEALTHAIEKSITVVMAAALPIGIGGVILGPPLIELLFGPVYAGSTLSFQILMLTLLSVFPGLLISNMLFAYNLQNVFILSTILGVTINIFLDVLLIPLYGIAGCAIATVIAGVVVYIFNWRSLKKVVDFKIVIHIKKIIIASAIMAVFSFVLFQFGLNTILIIIISAIIYFCGLYLLKEKTLEELPILTRRSSSVS